MRVKARRQRTPPVAILTPARDGDEHEPGTAGSVAQALCQLIPVHAGHPDVEQAEVRVKGRGLLQRGDAIVGHAHVMALRGEQGGQHVRGVPVVVDHQDAAGPPRRRRRRRAGVLGGRRRLRQPNRERRAMADAAALGRHAAAVQFRERLDEGQTDAEPAVTLSPHLDEAVEDAFDVVCGNPVAAVAHRNRDHAGVDAGAHVNRRSGIAVPDGVAEQVDHHLHDAVGIDLQPEPLGRQGELQRVVAGLQARRHRVDRVLDQRAQLARTDPQLEAVARDPCEVEQVVHEVRQVLHLSLDRVSCPLGDAGRPVEQLDGEPDRRERVAELVRERGDEVALLLVGLEQRLLTLPERALRRGPFIGCAGELDARAPHEGRDQHRQDERHRRNREGGVDQAGRQQPRQHPAEAERERVRGKQQLPGERAHFVAAADERGEPGAWPPGLYRGAEHQQRRGRDHGDTREVGDAVEGREPVSEAHERQEGDAACQEGEQLTRDTRRPPGPVDQQ